MADRRQPRLPISLEVAYRTAGAFLVSYSINLSKGGIFLETSQPLPIGEHVSLRFDVPGVGPLEVNGAVAWVRNGSMDGLPDGMGIQFDQLDQQYGEIIDEMVRGFVGLTVLVIAASPDRLALIGRYVRSIITCEIVEATNASVAEVALEQGPDLVVVDLDLLPEMGLRCIRAAKERAKAQAHPTPVVLLAGDARARQAGKTSGADEALATPPSYHDLQAAVIRMLSRPASVR
ncbi:MAG TPA: TIGR02266 family protein [Polyangia bacterium]